jgi:aryl-alcohol dehydrogenase-like predicted oxidoreductase
MTLTFDNISGSARMRLGHSDLIVRPIGLGCMGMSQFYGPADDEQSVGTILSALDLGVDFLDTSDIYGAANMLVGAENRGFGHNEQLIGRAIAGRRDRVVLATKFAVRLTEDGKGVRIDGHPDYVAAACEASLRRLNVEVIDLYYAHRLDPNVPVEDTIGAMARLVEQGKVRAIGLSEVSTAQLRRAHAT